jgi:spore germination protein GerM
VYKKVALLIALLMIITTGCGARLAQPLSDRIKPQALPAGNDDFTWATIFLAQGDYLVPVTVRRENTGKSLPGEAIEALLEWNTPEWAVSPLPATTEIRQVSQDGGLAVVDFGRQTLSGFSGGTLGEKLLLDSLVLTLTAIDGIERVQILVEGKVEDAAFGHVDTTFPLEPPPALNLEQSVPAWGETGLLRLWFMDPQAMFVVPVSRPVVKERLNHQFAILELLKGPAAGSPLLSPFPDGTTVLRVSLDGKTCTVDLSREFIQNHIGGSAVERMILQALVLTLTEFEDVSEVVLLVEGKPGEALLGHVDTSRPLVREYPNMFN